MSAGALGCAPTQAVRPPANPGMGSTARRDLYDRYKLEYHASIWEAKWARSDGEFTLGELSDVLDAYPESREIKTLIRTGEAVSVGMAVASGAILGYALTVDGLSSGTRQSLYIASGSIFVGALVVQLVWPGKRRDVSDVYNRALLKDLTETSVGLDRPARRSRPVLAAFALAPTYPPPEENGRLRGVVATAVWAF